MTDMLRTAHASARWKAASLCLLVLLADFLFHPRPGSLTFAPFTLALLAGFLLHNARRIPAWEAAAASLFIAGQVAAFALSASVLSGMLILLGFLFLHLRCCGFTGERLKDWPAMCAFVLLQAPALPIQAADKLSSVLRRRKRQGRRFSLRHWVLPLLATVVFLILLNMANPVLNQWWRDMVRHLPLQGMSGGRSLLWLSAAVIGLSCIRPRLLHRPSTAKAAEGPTFLGPLFTREAVLRALVLCNLLFLAHSVADVIYLWGGAELPAGIGYADYARRGAYTLLAAALLAAGFVLVALREGVAGGAVRTLLLAWVGQNILMTASAMQRLALYVEAYSLTLLRGAAFVWMLLVLIGLALILLRILWRKSSVWLVRMNLATALVVLYAAAFADTGGLIAAYNVAHSREMGGPGPMLDVEYLASEIGTNALPALLHHRGHADLNPMRRAYIDEHIERLSQALESGQKDWRNRHLRDYLLHRSLTGQK